MPGTQVDCYSHWSELEPTLVPEQYDLLFLDMRLEDCLGAELIVPIQELSPKTRIVLLSAFAQNDLLIKCLNLGIVGYISKTSPIETLLEAVNAVAAGGTFLMKTSTWMLSRNRLTPALANLPDPEFHERNLHLPNPPHH